MSYDQQENVWTLKCEYLFFHGVCLELVACKLHRVTWVFRNNNHGTNHQCLHSDNKMFQLLFCSQYICVQTRSTVRPPLPRPLCCFLLELFGTFLGCCWNWPNRSFNVPPTWGDNKETLLVNISQISLYLGGQILFHCSATSLESAISSY